MESCGPRARTGEARCEPIFAIDSVAQGDTRTLDQDLIGVDPSWLTVFSTDFDRRYDGSSTIGGYGAYWIHSDAQSSVDRAIVAPTYQPDDRREVLGQAQANFTITDVTIVEGDGASQDDDFLGAGEGAVTVEATVENAGGAADVQFVDLAVDAMQNGTFERVDRSAALALDPGASDTVTLRYDASHEDAPAIDLRVETADDVSPVQTVTFDGGVFAVSDQALTLNDELVVEAVDVGGEATIEAVHDGSVVGSRTVTEENDTNVRVGLDQAVTGDVDVRLLDAQGDELATRTVTISEPTIGIDASAPANASADETVQVDVDVANDALVVEPVIVELTVDGQRQDATAVNVDDATTVTLELDTGDLDGSAGDTIEYTVSAGDGSDTGQLTIE